MEKVSNVIASLNERGVPNEVSLIYGLPFQTLESFRASVDWCLSRGMPRVRAWPLMLLRGTGLEAQRDQWGFVESGEGGIPIVVEAAVAAGWIRVVDVGTGTTETCSGSASRGGRSRT